MCNTWAAFMDFVSKTICSFTTKRPDHSTVPESWYQKVSDRHSACSNDNNVCILGKAHKRLLTVQHKFSVCVVKGSLLFIVMSSSLTLLPEFTLLFSIINSILLFSVFDLRSVIWNLRRFATMLLLLNHLRIKLLSLDNLRVASSNFGKHEYTDVSSAKLQTSFSWMKNIRLFIKRLNNVGNLGLNFAERLFLGKS